MPKTLFRIRIAACLVSIVSLVLLFMPAGNPVAATSTLTQCKFSSYQVFDVQWSISGGNLYISNVTKPYDADFYQPTTQSGDYYQFFDSATHAGTYGLKLFNSDSSLQQLMHNTGNFRAMGTDFLFYEGSGFYGTVFTTTQGLAYGSSAVLPVTQQYPTPSQVAANVNCSSTPIEQVGTTTTTTAPPTTTTPPSGLDGSACASSFSASDFALGGGTYENAGTVRLTQASNNQFGAIWNQNRLDISDDICIRAETFLGNFDGADGLALVLQPNSTAAGTTGGGLGYMGITPSFALEFDTWSNSGDPYADHIGLMKNGDTQTHNQFGENFVDLGATDIEDGQWRAFKLYWNASSDEMSVLFDKNADGDLSDTGELVFDAVTVDLGALFPQGYAYWGFTAATGGSYNLQQVRNITYEVLERVNVAPTMPSAPSNTTIQATVAGNVPFTLSDDSTTASQWAFTYSSSNTAVVPVSAISTSMQNATDGQITITPPSGASGSSTITMNARDADGDIISSSFVVTVTAAPNSLVVTSLTDSAASGTLRWAITQANSLNGGIYDSITFASGLNGTITLSSSLPQVVGALTITGNGQSNTIIDGNSSYRPFWVGQNNSLTISNMTLKRGINGDGGLIFNTKGTVSATNVRFTSMSGGTAVFNKEAGSIATYTSCTFDALNVGIGADHGSTPSLAAGTTTWANQPDSVFQNRTYVSNSTFTGNSMAINSQRFTKVENSTFTNNTYGAALQGWNRAQVLNSTFTGNGIAIYHSNWINTTANMGTDNRFINGNNFVNNGISIYLDDTWTDSKKNQSWSTITNNNWDALGVWVRYYQWNGTTNAMGTARPYTTGTVFTQSANTFPDTIGAPNNLTATDTGTSIVLSWSAPTTGGYLPERYAIGLNTEGQNGWGLATGNVGDSNALNTTYTISYSLLESLMPSGTTWSFHIRSDNDTFGKYSANSNAVSMQVGTPPATTTTTSTTSTTVPPQEPVVPSPEITTPETVAPEPEQPAESTTPDSVPEDSTPETVPAQPDEDFVPSEESPAQEENPQTENTEPQSSQESESQPETTEEDTQSSIDTITEEIAGQIENLESPEEIVDAVTSILEEIAPEDVAEVVESVLESITEDTQVSELTEEDKEQIAAVVEAVLESGVDESTAAVLASNAAVLASINTEQAAEVFETVNAEELTEEAADAIVDAVQDASEEIRDVFEDAVDLFQGAFDEYTMLGQTINVGQRRTIVAVNLIATTTAALATAGGAMGPSSGGSPSSPSGSTKSDVAARKEEEESEAAGEIAGDGLDWIKKLSIYKTVNGEKVMDWKAFIKKFWFGLLNMGFTLAGSLVVYLTLSGPIQKIAGITTVMAIAAAMYLHMKEPDGE